LGRALEGDHPCDRRAAERAGLEPMHGACWKRVGQLDCDQATPAGPLGPRQLVQAQVARGEQLIGTDKTSGKPVGEVCRELEAESRRDSLQ